MLPAVSHIYQLKSYRLLEMQSRESIIRRLRAVKTDVQARYPVQRLALFGSWARGEQQQGSDIDILVEVDGSIGLRFINLAQDLEAYLGQKVDLVSRRAIKPTMWQCIERDLIDV